MKTALEKITDKARQLKKSFPNTKWTDLVKKASTELKKVGAIGDFKKNKAEFVEARTPKKPRKKRTRSANVYSVSRTATGRFKKKGMKQTHSERYSVKVAGVGAVKKPVKTSTHKDTKSHNVNIRVVSGINQDNLKQLNHYVTKLTDLKHILSVLQNDVKQAKKNKDLMYVKKLLDAIKHTKMSIEYTKHHIAIIKKNIK
jgi:hypothetical protein